MRIYCVITTKNRVELFKRALDSVHAQTKQPNKIIIVSDSENQNFEEEKKLISKTDIILRDLYTNNYAGSLNTALDYILKEEIANESEFNLSDIYIAFLDDDDTWRKNYLEKCRQYLYDFPDFVVAGINYIKDGNKEGEKLSIPKALDKGSFLSSNPHIQGSNTFIKLETLLYSGQFDESMNSTTDRDFFTRVMHLEPKYKIINEILVDVDASNLRQRLTNNKEGKAKSLSYFFSKYGGLMNKEQEINFFERSKLFADISSKEDIIKNLSTYTPSIQNEIIREEINNRIVFAYIMSDFNLGKRLYENILEYNLENYKIVIFDNTDKKNKLNKNENIIIFTLDDFKKYTESVDILKNMKSDLEGIITDICISRIILNKFIKENTIDGDIIWILDDDMLLEYLSYENGEYIKNKLDIKYIVSKYYNKCDVVIGSYSLDPPVPLLSTLRTSLLDFTYKNFLNKNNLYKTDILNYRDYYYDYAQQQKGLETPLPCFTKNIDDIFSGKANSRFLFVKNSEETFEPYSRGGNTIIFNREVLDIPNIAPKFCDKIARRSDFLWVKIAKEKNFKIIGASFTTLQDRIKTEFNFDKEFNKLLKDTLGSSFTKCYEKGQNEQSILNFQKDILNRICRIVASFYRIHGLLSICKDEKYIKYFSPSKISWYINKFKEYISYHTVKSAFKCVERNIWRFDNSIKIQKYLEQNKDYKLIGYGSEGFVNKKNNSYKKIYYKELSQDIIDINLKVAKLKSDNFLPIEFRKENDKTILYYEAEGDFFDYQGGYIRDIVNLINTLKDNNLVLTNLKSENFKINKGHLVLIDYGKNIEIYTPEKFERQIKRAFQMCKFYNATNEEFGEIINLSYKNLDMGYNFGINSFRLLLENRGKEAILDFDILNLILKYKPKTLLDYGAGKCKITNSISQYIKCSVFDIDLDTLKKRCDSKARIIENIDEIISKKEKFEMIICNLVLCNVNEEWNNKILFNINNLLIDKGHLIVSICNPFFDNVKNTELRIKGYEGDYTNISQYKKVIIYGNTSKEKEDYHRPFSYYENIFQRNGFKILNIYETNGVNIDSLNSISEHLIFDLEKNNYNNMNDCSLLIKTCSMDYLIADSCIRHIVNKLEYGQKFKERLVIVDGENPNRNRPYSKNNLETLRKKLDELKQKKIIDTIIYCNNEEGFNLYEKYFNLKSKNAYAKNGQQLLTSLKGFENIKTRYVYQTDIDIFFRTGFGDFYKEFIKYKESKALTGCLSILKNKSEDPLYGKRVEVRSSFIDIEQLNKILPLKNTINNEGQFELPWHRALDKYIEENKNQSIRFSSENIGFMHIENKDKEKDKNNLNIISAIFNSNFFNPNSNNDNINFTKDENTYRIPKDEVIIFSRGRNTPVEKIKRMLDSLKRQNYQNFSLVYFDDNSNTKTKEYLYMLSQYDSWCKYHMYFIENIERNGGLKNLDLAINELILNNNQIIINLDDDDALLVEDAIETIKSYFDEGYDVTIGNLFRTDKPFKKYSIVDFKKSWERDGDNIWLHPKCFRRILFNYIGDFLKDENGNYIESMPDYAMMLPIFEFAKKPKFIKKCLYYFEPSNANVNKLDEYKEKNIEETKNYLFNKAKKLFSKPIISVIGDANIDENSDKFKFAEKLGKTLIDRGYRIKTGGLNGVMKAVFKGGRESENYMFGDLIAILPGNKKNISEFADIEIATGKDIMRGEDVVDADAVISIGGGTGTLNEISIAWAKFKLILACTEFDGWSKELANKKIDSRIRYVDIEKDCVYGFKSIEECIELLEKYIHIYKREYHGIK